MADIRPFSCVRPAVDWAAQVAALPYDVYNTEEAREIVDANPHSFLAIDRAETSFPVGTDPYADCVYERARELLAEWTAEGIFTEDKRKAYYIYEQTMNGRVQSGIVACASIDDYENNIIKKHENTRADKERDRIRHVDTCNAQTGSIFLAYRANAVLSALVEQAKEQEPLYDFLSADGVRQRVFLIADEERIKTIATEFAAMDRIYIADGHHRAASAVRVGQMRRQQYPDYDGTEEFNYFLSVLFPSDELAIMDYNRVVKDLNGLSEAEFLACVEERFDVESLQETSAAEMDSALSGETASEADDTLLEVKAADEYFTSSEEIMIKADTETEPEGDHATSCISVKDEPNKQNQIRPTRKGEFSMYLNGQWYRCRMRAEDIPEDPVGCLDVSMLQNRLLDPVLGITDPKTDERIDFVGGIRGLAELEHRCKEDCVAAFAMYPTSIEELFAVADAGLLMPPKSTWFEPKLLSGLFIHRL